MPYAWINYFYCVILRFNMSPWHSITFNSSSFIGFDNFSIVSTLILFAAILLQLGDILWLKIVSHFHHLKYWTINYLLDKYLKGWKRIQLILAWSAIVRFAEYKRSSLCINLDLKLSWTVQKLSKKFQYLFDFIFPSSTTLNESLILVYRILVQNIVNLNCFRVGILFPL